MTKSDIWSPKFNDIAAAMTLLTRVPLGQLFEHDADRQAASAWAYPIVGLLLGIGALLVCGIAAALSLPAFTIAILVLIYFAFATGAMHLDGWADTLDGFWGGWTLERRLEIMKDSRVGVYGVAGIVLILALNISLLSEIIANGKLLAIVGCAAFSRALMVGLMHYVPNARSSGLSAKVGIPPKETAWIALAVGGLACLILSGFWAVLFATGAAIGIAVLADRKIGGQTGDVLGAAQQAAETAAYIAVVWMLA